MDDAGRGGLPEGHGRLPEPEVVITTGESARRLETATASTFTPKTYIAYFSVHSVSLSVHQSVSGLYMSLVYE